MYKGAIEKNSAVILFRKMGLMRDKALLKSCTDKSGKRVGRGNSSRE